MPELPSLKSTDHADPGVRASGVADQYQVVVGAPGKYVESISGGPPAPTNWE